MKCRHQFIEPFSIKRGEFESDFTFSIDAHDVTYFIQHRIDLCFKGERRKGHWDIKGRVST